MWCWATGSEDEALLAERDYGRECAREFAAQFSGRASAAQQEIWWPPSARDCPPPSKIRAAQFRFTPSRPRSPTPSRSPEALSLSPSRWWFCVRAIADEMAFFLGHEMGHILRGHASEQLTAGAFLNAVTARLPGAGGMLHQVLNKGYSRQLEFDADREAVRLAGLAGFDPRAAVRAMQTARRRSRRIPPDFAEYFSSHPPFADRIRELEKLVGA